MKISCKLSEVLRNRDRRPCLVHQELHISNAENLKAISFKNYYTAGISIKQSVAGKAPVMILKDYQLMENPHFEGDAQIKHTIQVSEFNAHFQPRKSIDLMIILIQPSSQWLRFEIQDVVCHERFPLEDISSKRVEVPMASFEELRSIKTFSLCK